MEALSRYPPEFSRLRISEETSQGFSEVSYSYELGVLRGRAMLVGTQKETLTIVPCFVIFLNP